MILERVVCLAVGYAFGLIQTGYIVGKINHVDIRKQGSGNAGSTNAVRVMGWKAGAATFAGDVLKCVVAVLLMRYIYRDGACAPLLGIYTGLGVTLGHNFPIYLKFKGGKGMAVMGALVLLTSPYLVPIPLCAFLMSLPVMCRWAPCWRRHSFSLRRCFTAAWGDLEWRCSTKWSCTC